MIITIKTPNGELVAQHGLPNSELVTINTDEHGNVDITIDRG